MYLVFFVIQLSTLCLHFVSLSDLKEFFKIKTAISNMNEVSEKVCETKQCFFSMIVIVRKKQNKSIISKHLDIYKSGTMNTTMLFAAKTV